MAKQIFLEQRSYRMRRMMDAVRLLPLLGLALWMVPLMWPVSGNTGDAAASMPTSAALSYIFAVWFSLVVAAGLLWRRTHGPENAGAQDTGEPSD
jgi:hypothetical protein